METYKSLLDYDQLIDGLDLRSVETTFGTDLKRKINVINPFRRTHKRIVHHAGSL